MFAMRGWTVWILALALGAGGPVWAQEQGRDGARDGSRGGWERGDPRGLPQGGPQGSRPEKDAWPGGYGEDPAVQQAFEAWLQVYEQRIRLHEQGLGIIDRGFQAIEADGQLQGSEKLDKVKALFKHKDQLLERIAELRHEIYEIRRNRYRSQDPARDPNPWPQAPNALPRGPNAAPRGPNAAPPGPNAWPHNAPPPPFSSRNPGPGVGADPGPGRAGPHPGHGHGPMPQEPTWQEPMGREWQGGDQPHPGPHFDHPGPHFDHSKGHSGRHPERHPGRDVLEELRTRLHDWLRRNFHGESFQHHFDRRVERRFEDHGMPGVPEAEGPRFEIRVERNEDGRGSRRRREAPGPMPSPVPDAGRFLIRVAPALLLSGPAFQAGEDEDLFDEEFGEEFGEDFGEEDDGEDGYEDGSAEDSAYEDDVEVGGYGDDSEDDLFDEEWDDVEQGLGEWKPPESHGPLDMLRKSERVQDLQRELQQRAQRWLMKNPDKLQKVMRLAQRAQKETEGFQRWVVQPAKEGDLERAARNASRHAMELAREFRPEWLPKEVLRKAEQLRRRIFKGEGGEWGPLPDKLKDVGQDSYVKLGDKTLTPEDVERIEWVSDKLMEMVDALDGGDRDTALAAGKELADRSAEWGAEAWEETLEAGGLYEVYQDAIEQGLHALDDLSSEIRDSTLDHAIRQLRELVQRGLDGERVSELRRDLLRKRVLRDAGRKARRLRMILKQHFQDHGFPVPRSTAKLREVFEREFPEFDGELKRLLPELFEKDAPTPADNGKTKDEDEDQDM